MLTTPDPDTRRRLDTLTVVATAAFAGAQLFIGLSMGAYWLSLDPAAFIVSFFGQWLRFLATIMPLLLLALFGLLRSMRQDASNALPHMLWRRALQCLIATCLITLVFHLPLNLRLGAGTYSPTEAVNSGMYGLLSIFGSVTPENASFTRSIWLIGHIPRVLLGFAVPYFAMRAVFARRAAHKTTNQ